MHLTNTTLFAYSGWANASAGACPCAPPCLCDWTAADWATVSSSIAPQKLVFIEVDADQQYWLAEAQWAQLTASAGGVAGSAISAIVAKAPPGFGSSATSDKVMSLYLDELKALPLVRGVRTYQNLSDPSTLPYALNHTRLLAARGLSLDICLGGLGGNPTATQYVYDLAAAVPSLTVILDHMVSPPVLGGAQAMATWSASLAALSALPNVFVKWGGLFQYFKTGLVSPSVFPTYAQVAPIAQQVLQQFGWSKCLFEANWFFVDWYMDGPGNGLDTYGVWTSMVLQVLGSIEPAPTPAQLDALFWGVGSYVYRV